MKQTDSPSHREVQDLLPWYVNGTLSPPEREAVAAHLAGCPGCAAEAGLLRSVGSAVKESNESLPPTSEGGWESLLSRVEREREAVAPPKPGGRFGSWWAALPASARWALAAQAVVVVALVCASAALLRRADPPEEGRGAPYEAMSGRREEAAGPFVTITVDFREGATVKDVRELLTGVRASVVSGPSSVGSYNIRVPVPPGADAEEVSRRALELLRARRDLVELAEPLP
jgi:anti-sigma factor RsiW